ncbi:hypothetical protein [Clostridium sp. DJ247]|uniref:hypothetical protein n=1 Tax=Clostridium sp. DJ247 TaxID=2726188 RepID=UPI001627B8C4|nr:hypothetical protein [Clostridium sp. DJ247]MBC2582869.1 hypothetical protein [Clostridium sp. DJ247]
MGTKKSIFEKFKLVEKIDEEAENQENIKLNNESSNQVGENHRKETNELGITNLNMKSNNVSINSDREEISEYKDRDTDINQVLSINEIYDKFTLENDNTKTVFIIDEFFKALPGNLPTEIRKQSVINIIKASGKDINLLKRDGESRLVILNDYIKEFAKKIEDSNIQDETEIKQLMNEIEKLKNRINQREQLGQEQKSIIEFEIQRLSNIIKSVE